MHSLLEYLDSPLVETIGGIYLTFYALFPIIKSSILFEKFLDMLKRLNLNLIPDSDACGFELTVFTAEENIS